MEIWKPIKGYEGFYEISNTGKVKSLKRRQSPKESILKPYLRGNKKRKYLSVIFTVGGIERKAKIHQLVALYFLKNPENKPYVHHIDNNPFNNHFENLMWCTAKENARFYREHKRAKEQSVI